MLLIGGKVLLVSPGFENRQHSDASDLCTRKGNNNWPAELGSKSSGGSGMIKSGCKNDNDPRDVSNRKLYTAVIGNNASSAYYGRHYFGGETE